MNFPGLFKTSGVTSNQVMADGNLNFDCKMPENINEQSSFFFFGK